jgi:hypothetical protein
VFTQRSKLGCPYQHGRGLASLQNNFRMAREGFEPSRPNGRSRLAAGCGAEGSTSRASLS